MAQRGRPRLLPIIPPTTLEAKVAEKLADECGTPGCRASFHLTEARDIIELVREGLSREKIN